MGKVIVMPKLGLTMTEGTIDAWKKNEGDAVKEGSPILYVTGDVVMSGVEIKR